MTPASELKRIGFNQLVRCPMSWPPEQSSIYEFGLAEISFMNETTAGRVIFGPDDAEPILGITALESVGVIVDPTNHTRKRLPAIPLK